MTLDTICTGATESTPLQTRYYEIIFDKQVNEKTFAKEAATFALQEKRTDIDIATSSQSRITGGVECLHADVVKFPAKKRTFFDRSDYCLRMSVIGDDFASFERYISLENGRIRIARQVNSKQDLPPEKYPYPFQDTYNHRITK